MSGDLKNSAGILKATDLRALLYEAEELQEADEAHGAYLRPASALRRRRGIERRARWSQGEGEAMRLGVIFSFTVTLLPALPNWAG